MFTNQELIQKIYKETGIDVNIHRCNEDYIATSVEPRSTSAIVLLVNTTGYFIDLMPAESTKQDIATYQCASFEEACKLFEALHFFRDYCVKPYIDELVGMI